MTKEYSSREEVMDAITKETDEFLKRLKDLTSLLATDFSEYSPGNLYTFCDPDGKFSVLNHGEVLECINVTTGIVTCVPVGGTNRDTYGFTREGHLIAYENDCWIQPK